jgi:serine/threonine protein kinase
MFKAQDQIGPYLLLKPLGNGAFGEVWLAEKRTAVTSIRVALKLPTRSAVDMDAVRQEAAVWEQAKGHANVLSLLDADIYEFQGREYVAIVSEYAAGGSLQERLEQRQPTMDEALAMLDGILRGLSHLHTRRPPIIHRDLKPANILLQSDTPCLADFGLARVLKSTAGSATIAGTVEYMSPDALDGARTVETDIWAAGVILYQMLAGRLPFPQKNKQELMYAIVMREPAPLPAAVPPELQAIVFKALQKGPLQRFATAEEMRQALRDEAAARHRAALFQQYEAEAEAKRQAVAQLELENEARRQREAIERQRQEKKARLGAELEARQKAEAEEAAARRQAEIEEIRRNLPPTQPSAPPVIVEGKPKRGGKAILAGIGGAAMIAAAVTVATYKPDAALPANANTMPTTNINALPQPSVSPTPRPPVATPTPEISNKNDAPPASAPHPARPTPTPKPPVARPTANTSRPRPTATPKQGKRGEDPDCIFTGTCN